MKFCIFPGTTKLDGFGEGFGSVLGGQNPQFLAFCVIFARQNWKYKLEREKIEKNAEKGPPPAEGRRRQPRDARGRCPVGREFKRG